MRCIQILILCIIAIHSHAQKHDYVWLTGVDSQTTIIDFNNGRTHDIQNDLVIDLLRAISGMSDSEGNLAYYTSGCAIVDSTLEFMEGGEDFNPYFACQFVGPPNGQKIAQTLISIPANEEDSLYYTIQQVIDSVSNPFSMSVKNIVYHKIDMSKNAGKGAIVEDFVAIVNDTMEAGSMSATLHDDSKSWWILCMEKDTNNVYKILMGEDGLIQVDTQHIGLRHTRYSETTGGSTFSPDGNTYARYTYDDGVFVYDFNNEDGMLSNFRRIQFADTASFGTVAVSANSRYLYTSTVFRLYQTDLWADNLQEATVLVEERDINLGDGPFRSNFYYMQLAPDCKIYMTTTFGGNTLSVIHAPNEPAEYCDFRQYSLELGQVGNGLPNFPHFRGMSDEVCDPTLVPVVKTFYNKEFFQVFPNPVEYEWTIDMESTNLEDPELRLYNAQGALIQETSLDIGLNTIEVESFIPGIYYYMILADAGRYRQQGKFIKI